jgi:hypothetical protein
LAPAAASPAASPAAPAAGRSQAALSSSSPAKAALSPRAMQHQARLLISTSQANSLLTAGAYSLRSVKEGSGAYVKVLLPDEAPLCALEGDRVTQVNCGGSKQPPFPRIQQPLTELIELLLLLPIIHSQQEGSSWSVLLLPCLCAHPMTCC